MTDSPITLDTGSSTLPPAAPRDEELSALMIAWDATEPYRIGEVALFEAEGASLVLGRGEQASGSGGERVVLYRQRPAVLERTPPLTSLGISRDQLRISLEGRRLHVERIGRCPMVIRGERVDRGVLEPGDTVLLKGQLLLLATRRPRRLPPLRSASIDDAPVFGAPDVHGIVGESPAAWRLRDQIAWIAAADEHTLLLGPTGSGKELAARAVHALSDRAQAPFVARNAATIPDGLVDAELFGNVKDYPNPGMPARAGLIGSAHGGTLFLDEIGELPSGLQANLLRVLDERGEYHCLGGSSVRRSNFRFLGATNSDPAALKHDLAARLVLRLRVPGLEERRDDIPLLARDLLRRAAAKSPDAVKRFAEPSADGGVEPRVKASLIAHLLRASYKTNVRGLDLLLWRAMHDSCGDAIEWPALAEATTAETDVSLDDSNPGATGPAAAEIRAALKTHAGNVVRTAPALGVSRYALYRLMVKYEIDPDEFRG